MQMQTQSGSGSGGSVAIYPTLAGTDLWIVQLEPERERGRRPVRVPPGFGPEPEPDFQAVLAPTPEAAIAAARQLYPEREVLSAERAMRGEEIVNAGRSGGEGREESER